MRTDEGGALASEHPAGDAARRFVHLLLDAVPHEFDPPVRAIQFGLKMRRKRGGYLIVWYRENGRISRFSHEPPRRLSESSEVVEAARTIFRRNDFANHRPAFLSLLELGQAANPNALSASAPTAAKDTFVQDPIAAIEAVGTIGRRSLGDRLQVYGTAVTSRSGPSGWSQEIGRRCEQIAFCWLLSRFDPKRCEWKNPPDGPARLSYADGIRTFEWLNAKGERGQSWDLEERDVLTNKILRKHEVKAPTAELTETEYAMARREGDAYLIWRVDPALGSVTRVNPKDPTGEPARWAHGSEGTGGQVELREVQVGNAPHVAAGWTPVVLRRSTRRYAAEISRSHAIVVGRCRGNKVIAVVTSPELESRLPPSPNRRWIANRSMEGCRRLDEALLEIEMVVMRDARMGVLLIGVTMTGSVGLRRAIERISASVDRVRSLAG
jgi:hypothetical protein